MARGSMITNAAMQSALLSLQISVAAEVAEDER
jgi:hypothetical protein